MSDPRHIPMFPLTILPLPGELVPLHIFEPRYRQLLSDAEQQDFDFGIYCNHAANLERLGSLMKLESVLKKYPGGESDIVVRCTDIFTMDKLYRTFHEKLYPGGDISLKQLDVRELPGIELSELFLIFQTRRNLSTRMSTFTVSQIAQELNLDLYERYRYLVSSREKREAFLIGRLKFQLQLLTHEEKSKDVFHLN